MCKIGFLCLTAWCVIAVGFAQSQQPCKPPPLVSGSLWVTDAKGLPAGGGKFFYDSPGKRLRFTDIESLAQKAKYLDVLFLFEEGIFYEINSKTSSCKKRPLQSLLHPMEVQPNMTVAGEDMYLGSRVDSGQGLNMRNWIMQVPQLNGPLVVTTSPVGCLTLSAVLFTQSKDLLLFSFLEVTKEVKDPQVFVPPAFCDGVPLEPEGNTFFGVFFKQAHLS